MARPLGSLTAVYNLEDGDPVLQYVYIFDKFGRTKREQFRIRDLEWKTSYDYNLAGQVTQVTYPDNSEVYYAYDNAGLPTTVASKNKTYATFNGFNAMGQLKQMDYGNGTTDLFTYYDPDQEVTGGQNNFRLKRIQTYGPGQNPPEYFHNEFVYTLPGTTTISSNIMKVKDPNFGEQVMTYDYLNRLTSSAQSAPTGAYQFQLQNGGTWGGYGSKFFKYFDNGNIERQTRTDILTPTNGDTLSTSAEIMNYTYDAAHPHAVVQILPGGTGEPVWGGTYDDNGSLYVKHSSLNPDAAPDQNYLYDSDGRMTAAVVQDGETILYRLSDSFYHLQGGRLFEGLLNDGYVQGTLSINPYYELKITNGQVYMVKHILAGGRRVASIYEKVTSYNRAGLGCSTIDNVSYASPKEILIGVFVLFGVPLFIVVLVSTRGFRSSGFKKHPIKSFALLAVCIICLIEFSPYPILLLDNSNPVDDRLIAKNLQAVLTGVYGTSKIPISDLDRKLFDKKKKEQEQKKPEKRRNLDGVSLRITLGPTEAKADMLVRDTLYFHTDQLGSTRLITKADGSRYQYLNYLPFGKILEGNITGPPLPTYAAFKNSYTGQEIDRSTGLYFYQARFYDADIGRFISADTVIPQPADGQTFNRYTYVNNNPFKFTDPTGHDFVSSLVGTIIGVIVGVIVGVAVTIVAGPVLGFIAGMAAGGAVSGFVTSLIESLRAGAPLGTALQGAFVSGLIGGAMGAAGAGLILLGVPWQLLFVASFGIAASQGEEGVEDWLGSFIGAQIGGFFASQIPYVQQAQYH